MRHETQSFRGPKIGLFQRLVLIVLIPSFVVDRPFVLSGLADQIDSSQQSQGPTYPSPITTAKKVKANRQLPDFTPPATTFKLSATPTDAEIFNHSPFEEPLVPMGGITTSRENEALAEALTSFVQRTRRDDFSALEGFVAANPHSAWNVALLTNLGWLYRQSGWYGKSLETFEQAWADGKKENTPRAKALVDRAYAELVVLNAILGRTDRLKPLLSEGQGRILSGSANQKIEDAKQSYTRMLTHPDKGFLCGPQAVDELRRRSTRPIAYSLIKDPSPSKMSGTTLTQNYQLAQKMSLDLIMAKREPGSDILLPSVVNWKVGHFAAITEKKNGLFRIHDPTFGDDVWVSQQALDQEASGYFLVKNQTLPSGWRQVGETEGQGVFGKGGGTGMQSKDSAGPTPKAGCDGPTSPMARYGIYEAATSLDIEDTPLFYTPAYGPKVEFKVTYGQREAFQPANFNYSNLGPLWTFNWLSYITDDPTNLNASVNQYLSGGGTLTYNYDSSISGFDPQGQTQGVLKIVSTSPIQYELDMPDGSKQIFAEGNSSTAPRKVFLTQWFDKTGNALTFSYDSNFRMVSVTDATGLVSSINYESNISSNLPAFYQIAGVTDPFGRTAYLTYNSAGVLASSQDVSGITSNYSYTQSSIMQSFRTPYGTTTFDVGQDSNKRWVNVTDPQGGQERVETWEDGPPPVTSGYLYTDGLPSAQVPSGITNVYMQYRNSFYWDRKQMMAISGASPGVMYADAQVTQWLHESSTVMSDIVESIQNPLESRVYYTYPGQTANSPPDIFTGTSAFPLRVVRVLASGSFQEWDYTYNSAGNVLTAKDPQGRITTYGYASNNIDVTSITQTSTADSGVLFGATYNSHHEPLTVTDAAGQTTTYTYLSATGQISTLQNAKGEHTNFTYNGHGQMLNAEDLTTGATELSLGYDGFGRVSTATDLNGYIKSYDYDSLNRVTKITYPDSTFDQFVYATLDLSLHKDRQNRWTRYFYNPLEQLIGVVDPQGRATNYSLCSCGALKSITDPNGNVTSFTQDLQGRNLTKTYADGTQISYTYEGVGGSIPSADRLASMTDAKSQTTTYSYNLDDTISSVGYQDSTSVSFAYDAKYPRITGMTDSTGSTAYGYYPTGSSGGGKVETEEGPLGSTAAITYGYDPLNRVTSTSINGAASTLSYDSLGRITSPTNPLGTFAYTYSGNTTRLTGLALSGSSQISTSYTYGDIDHDFRLSEIKNLNGSGGVISQNDYTYNPVGTLLSWKQQTDSGTTNTIWNYAYDNADQLLSGTKTNFSTGAVLAKYVYGYDLAGNRTSLQNGTSVTQTSYNNLNQIQTASAGGPMQFSGTLNEPVKQVTVKANSGPANLAQIEGSTNFIGYASVTAGSTNSVAVAATDYSNHAVTNSYQVVVPASASTGPTFDANGSMTYNGNSGNAQNYTWDAKGRLASITYSGGSTTAFTYDGLGRRVAIVEWPGTVGTGAPTSTKDFVWVGLRLAEERSSSTTVTKRFYEQGEQIGGTSYYYTRDHLGSVRELTTASGTVEARYDYDPYGRTTLLSGTNLSDFQYAGMYEHQPSGLNLTMFRAYDPTTGRWLSRDLLGEGADATLYSYVWNNSINLVDPWGLTGYHAGRGTRNPGSGSEPNEGGPSGLGLASGAGGAVTALVMLNLTPAGPVADAGALAAAVFSYLGIMDMLNVKKPPQSNSGCP